MSLKQKNCYSRKSRDLAIAFGIEEENEKHLIQSWKYFTTQDREKANVRKCLLEYLPYFKPLNTQSAKYF